MFRPTVAIFSEVVIKGKSSYHMANCIKDLVVQGLFLWRPVLIYP
jgi:hypothetical protein